MIQNVSQLSNCFGCSVCSAICPKHIIFFEKNIDGFFQPVLKNEDSCINCGQCLKVCSYIHKDDVKTINFNFSLGYATWSKDPAVRRKSSSGGTGFEIAFALLKKGYKVIVVKYNAEKERAEHYVASSREDLIASMGSKYIQSYPKDVFDSIQKGEKYLIVGTPCQIASLRKYVNFKHMEEDAILMDFFCHGVPSLNMWHKYIKEAEKKVGKVTSVSWRNKQDGWHNSWVISIDGIETADLPKNRHEPYDKLISGRKSHNKKRSDGDLFYKFFLGDMCFNKTCYKDCRFKILNSLADIRIGDLWGSKYGNDELGVTGVISFTEMGKKVLFDSNIELIPESIEVVTEGQMKKNPDKPYYYDFLMRLFRSSLSLKTIYRFVQILRIGTIIKYKLNL